MADAKITRIVWEDVRQAILNTRLVDSVRWWFSKRKIRSLVKQLVAPPQLLSRRGVFGTPLLLLAPFRPEPLPPHVIKDQIIAAFLNTQQGRAKLAQAMIQPIRRRLSCTTLTRAAFPIELLPAGVRVYDEQALEG